MYVAVTVTKLWDCFSSPNRRHSNNLNLQSLNGPTKINSKNAELISQRPLKTMSNFGDSNGNDNKTKDQL
jgi:hypothetical protein